ncbi:MAG: hypothetical protein JWO94_2662 [Verrucomicrobiaceae bacterium]|nr:hypothetical protein [Verrucomicrobiaceae bacterium]
MLTIENCHDPAGDIQEFQKFCLIADKIEADPALLSKPLDCIDRWIARGSRAQDELLQWRALVAAAQQSAGGMDALLAILRDDSEPVRYFKGFAPFPGILTLPERRSFPWISRH